MAPHVKVTPKFRKKVVSLKASRLSFSVISRKINSTKSVISRILKLYDEKKTFSSTSIPGRPRITTKRKDKAVKRYVNNNPFETAVGISRKIKILFNKDVSCYIVSHRLNDFGLKVHSPLTKPLINKKNRVARLTYAEAHVIWQETDWDKVNFSDESKFNLVGSDGRQFVRRVIGDRLNPRCVKKSVKF